MSADTLQHKTKLLVFRSCKSSNSVMSGIFTAQKWHQFSSATTGVGEDADKIVLTDHLLQMNWTKAYYIYTALIINDVFCIWRQPSVCLYVLETWSHFSLFCNRFWDLFTDGDKITAQRKRQLISSQLSEADQDMVSPQNEVIPTLIFLGLILHLSIFGSKGQKSHKSLL